MDLLARLEELERRMAQMVVRGKIVEVDAAQHAARVEYGPNMTTGWLQWKPVRSGKAIVWWVPEVGEGVTVISEGDLALGEILPGSYHKDFAAPSTDPDVFLVQYGDGSRMAYDRKAHLYTLDLPAGGRVELVAPGGFKLTGDTKIEGALHVTKNIKGDAEISDQVRNMSADRLLYSAHKHGNSPAPDPQQ